jgi:hypothetical protein
MTNNYKNVQSAIDNLLNVKCVVRRKRKNEYDKKKELFIFIVNNIETAIIRSNIALTDLKLDYSDYDEVYFAAIDALLLISFGKDAAELIAYYLWDRINPDGSINPIFDENNNEIVLKDVNQLWELVCKLNPKI